MVKAMIILSKEEKSSKVRKLEKDVIEIIQEFGVVPKGGSATELSFMVDMSKEDLKKAEEGIKYYSDKAGFDIEVILE